MTDSLSNATVYAPGRAELLGNHTDYNEGLVLSLAINCGTTLKGTKREDDQIILKSVDFNTQHQARISELSPSEEQSWANYVLGVFAELTKKDITVGGIEIEISTTIPIGAGLSSSAALETATALVLQKLYPYELSPLEIATVAQQAEHHYTGVKCGLLDQISVLMSKDGHATSIDCRSFEVGHMPLKDNTAFVIIHSGAKHELTAGEYNERRESCEAAAKALGKEALRDVTPDELTVAKDSLDEKLYKRARHVVDECERVHKAGPALAEHDMATLGKLMTASHRSSQEFFENSCEELDILVELALQQPGCLGSRLSGGGFGGATINLVTKDQAEAFVETVTKAYQEKTHIEPTVVVTPASNGALYANNGKA